MVTMWEESFVAMSVLLGEDAPAAVAALAPGAALRAAPAARKLAPERPRRERASALAALLEPIARAVEETALT